MYEGNQRKKVTTIQGNDVVVGCETICVHSDTPNAVEILKALREKSPQIKVQKKKKIIQIILRCPTSKTLNEKNFNRE